MLAKNGYRHVDGRIERDGVVVPADTEEEFFRLAGLPCEKPAARDALIQKILRGGTV
jgi:hypothetical protein